MRVTFAAFLATAAMNVAMSAVAADAYSESSPTAAPRYTFSWPLDTEGLKPRGGTTKGAPLTLDRNESSEWKALQEPSLSSFERDRRAILAMAGTYRVTFDFLEVVSYAPSEKPLAPYQSWGTEKVYVDIDEGKTISLVHILEMRIVQSDGAISEPMVTKHWRQDWRYEPDALAEYQGHDQWAVRKLPSNQKGTWSQSVYQVDESPRYASVGRWEHSPSFSTWISADTWRPLPRREWSVRDDYQVLLGTNRHTVLPTGWVQEENNLKAVVSQPNQLDRNRPFVGREYGIARYERIRESDFAAADEYYERTRLFWREVRGAWSAAFKRDQRVALKGPVDKLGLFVPLFERADAIAQDPAEQGNAAKNREVIRGALNAMGVAR